MPRVLFLVLGLVGFLAGCAEDKPPPVSAKPIAKMPVRIGAKDFPEQRILANAIATLLNSSGNFDATVIGPYPTTKAIHKAFTAGDIDLYVEYTGTATEAILGLVPLRDPEMDNERLRKFYEEKFQADWLLPLGFENTYVFAARDDGRAGKLMNFSELAKEAIGLTAGLDTEFVARPDGYPLLQDRYGMVFQSVRPIVGGAAYEALDSGKVDVIAVNSTDGELIREEYHVQNDNLGVLPAYSATPVVRMDTEGNSPGLEEILWNLGGKIATDTIRKLNAEVVVNGRSEEDVAREFVEQNREYLLAPTKLPRRTRKGDIAPAESFPASSVDDASGKAAPIAPVNP